MSLRASAEMRAPAHSLPDRARRRCRKKQPRLPDGGRRGWWMCSL